MPHKKYVCAPPPIESLLEESTGQIFWPKKVTSRPDFSRKIKSQQNLLRQVRDVFASLPLHLTLTEGLSQGFIPEAEAEKLCNLLAFQLESDDAQKRLALYLPFELLSPITVGRASLLLASERLQTAYQLAWEAQLSQHEVRANFVDGDVLEPELLIGDYPRVVKAAHLIPGLLQTGHLTVADVQHYVQYSTDGLMTNSIMEACHVATDLGLYPKDFSEFSGHLEQAASIRSSSVTEGRARWLASVADAKKRQEKAETIALALENGLHVSELVSDQELAIALEAVRIAALRDKTAYNHHRSWLRLLADTNHEPCVRDSISTLFSHLYTQGLINEKELGFWNINVPHLNGPFYQNRHYLKPAVADILSMCKQTAEHPQLNALVYPVALILGSQIKGYGLAESDCDIAVFVQPGVSRNKRHYIEQELAKIYSHVRFDGGIKLFWLSEIDEHLQVIDWSESAASDASSNWTHVLFGALWFGEENCLGMLHQQLLTPYFSVTTTKLLDKPVYERWLEEMERDSLQYRLLHKGFERYYLIQSPMNTEHGNLIDGQSAFYDSKYRRIATELFVRRVFLPQL